ncbi:MAG: hypothetical protein JWR80_2950 [Bradyrhizobium sp.]|nr:hypothetical protein [Bradyrhizobium sp.]
MGAQVAERAAVARLDAVAAIVLLTPSCIALPTEVATEMRELDSNRAGQVQLRTQFAAPLPEAAPTRFLDVGMKVSAPAAAARFRMRSAGDPAGNDPTAFGGPALIAGGQADGFVTPDLLTAVIARRFPQAVVGYVPNAGHRPHVEQPAASAELLTAFLDTIDRSRIAKRRGEP